MEIKNKKKRKMFNFEIDSELHKRLAKICIEDGISMRSFITEAVEEKIQKQKQK